MKRGGNAERQEPSAEKDEKAGQSFRGAVRKRKNGLSYSLKLALSSLAKGA